MLENKMAGFVAKRVLIWCCILSIVDILLFTERWHILPGLLIGSALSVLKFGSYIWIFKKILSPGNASSNEKAKTGGGIMVFAMNQIMLLPLLYLAYVLDQWFFAGIVAGILLVPFVLMINCITEALGLTKNNFGE